MKPADIKAKYPDMFKSCFDFSIDEGWCAVVDELCAKLSERNEARGHTLEVVQVKEKFGGLRFYAHGADELDNALIYEAEKKCDATCEACGTTQGVTTRGPGWIRTLCGGCRK